jgi:hypothetical protein
MARIALPFSVQNAQAVIAFGASSDAPHTHAEIADWCERFWTAFCDVDAPAEIERIMPILAEVESQWDMFLADTLSKQPGTSSHEVQAPTEWFLAWGAQIDG